MLKRGTWDHTYTYTVSCPCEPSAEVSSSKVLEEDTPDTPNTQERNNSGSLEVTQLFSPGGGTLIFLYIRRLGPFFWGQIFEFQYFLGFSEK